MSRKVRSVRVPEELETLDLSEVVHECEGYRRDLESATLHKAKGDRRAAEALILARQADLGRKIAMKVWEARVRFGAGRLARTEEAGDHGAPRADE